MPSLDPHVHPYPNIHPSMVLLHDFYTKTSNLMWRVNWSGLYDLSCSHQDSYDIFSNCRPVIANNKCGSMMDSAKYICHNGYMFEVWYTCSLFF